MNTENSKDVLIFDLDGTLALCDHRRHFVEGKDKDWNAFYEACDEDLPNKHLISILKSFESKYQIAILSGRSSQVREKTERWLKEHEIFPDILLMRSADDYTPDDVLKKSWLDQYFNKEKVVAVFDDRKKVVDMWRREGLLCLQVAEGNF